MEEEKKKKRNKKKKNKQGKTTEEEADQIQSNNVSNGQSSGNNALDLDTHQPNIALASSADEMINELRKEKNYLYRKRLFCKREFNTCDMKMNHTDRKRLIRCYLGGNATLEETIKKLRNEFDSHLKKEAGLGMNVIGLQNEKESWLQEKASLEEKISHLLDEKAALDLKRANLEENVRQLEKEKYTWILTENSTKQSISSLNRDITRLKMQVVELEESRSELSRENQHLAENISSMQLHIQNLERNITSSPPFEGNNNKLASGYEDLKSQIEAASVFVEKLVMENAELVQKVNELVGFCRSFSNYERRIEHENVDVQPAAPFPRNVEPEVSEEIVQIPLDDTDVRNLESRSIAGEENAVPLTDAPLIGAPFRLVSFVASYVTGADLVNNT
ncbi:Thioredoxin H-type 9, H9,TH9 [Hibiscus syriacus]|uniref:Thioredoxin H-type 9, H9,TH9 n=1 Tax=Hibiscus syriacus TaxID=106335 RepID=A0A6A3C4S2_HIBSY|nr:Thioredoxin H-type 9, H9,TH9 [Hibiscus syriacus]